MRRSACQGAGRRRWTTTGCRSAPRTPGRTAYATNALAVAAAAADRWAPLPQDAAARSVPPGCPELPARMASNEVHRPGRRLHGVGAACARATGCWSCLLDVGFLLEHWTPDGRRRYARRRPGRMGARAPRRDPGRAARASSARPPSSRERPRYLGRCSPTRRDYSAPLDAAQRSRPVRSTARGRRGPGQPRPAPTDGSAPRSTWRASSAHRRARRPHGRRPASGAPARGGQQRPRAAVGLAGLPDFDERDGGLPRTYADERGMTSI